LQYEITYKVEWTCKVDANSEQEAKEKGLDELGVNGESVLASPFPDRIELKVNEHEKVTQ